MPKPAQTQKAKSVTNKHVYSRVSYLYQAAAYLAANTKSGTTVQDDKSKDVQSENSTQALSREHENVSQASDRSVSAIRVQLGSQRHLASHMRAVSLKGQVRLSRDVKRSLCKRCDAYLVPSSTCTSTLENKSRLNKKPHADVHILTCSSCGADKRFPIGATRQKPKTERSEAGNSKRPVVQSEVPSLKAGPVMQED